MDGTLIIKRDPVTIGAVLISLLGVLGVWLDWNPTVTAALIALVTAAVGIVQALNVFGTDKFTSVALNFMGAILGALIAFNVNLADDVQTAIMAAVPIILGLFARNGVTNRLTETGAQRAVYEPRHANIYTAYSSDPKADAAYHGEGQGPGGGG